MGHVGAVTAVCLASKGHEVVAFDTDASRIEAVLAGRAPVFEPGLDALVAEVVATGRLRATTALAEAVAAAEILLVCVGTPALEDGGFDPSALVAACDALGGALADAMQKPLVAIRSTVLPGTTRTLVIPALEHGSRKRVGDDFGVCVNPEFLREGVAIADFLAPPKVVIGELDRNDGDRLLALLDPAPNTPLIRGDFEAAELLKYTDNAWHALKVSFANEIGALAAASGVDGLELMEQFGRDLRLNVSVAYLRPGTPFGGACLSKDLGALRAFAADRGVRTPVLDGISASNRAHLDRLLAFIAGAASTRIGLVGLGFKAGTGDLRDSPFVALADTLIARGHVVRYFDRCVNDATHAAVARLVAASSLSELVEFAQTIVLCHRDDTYNLELQQRLTPAHRILDLGGSGREACAAAEYMGFPSAR
ncbi:MAG: nucleotide sugar dehydrogenase [Pseudomonadota bacterium]|nr:nucleotide sugar dehydrogenase [Pseudomonadota bacterium]